MNSKVNMLIKKFPLDVCFDDTEDYMIKNMEEKEEYWKIVNEKGFNRVRKRKLFLGPKIN